MDSDPRLYRRGMALLMALAVTTLGFPLAAIAAEATDKRGYSIFNPMPTQLMRPMSADRPDFTESSYTVDTANGNMQLCWKINLWGNAGGQTAFGLMPFVKIPVASDDVNFFSGITLRY